MRSLRNPPGLVNGQLVYCVSWPRHGKLLYSILPAIAASSVFALLSTIAFVSFSYALALPGGSTPVDTHTILKVLLYPQLLPAILASIGLFATASARIYLDLRLSASSRAFGCAIIGACICCCFLLDQGSDCVRHLSFCDKGCSEVSNIWFF